MSGSSSTECLPSNSFATTKRIWRVQEVFIIAGSFAGDSLEVDKDLQLY
jgi:hypothetical protein